MMLSDAMDLVDSDDISETAILNELKRRFSKDTIYSSIGPIIIALNPYKNISSLYTNQNMAKYLSFNTGDNVNLNPPHIWTIAQQAYGNLTQYNVRQAIVISGESGAGKTEATKKCLQYLSAIAHNSPHTADNTSIQSDNHNHTVPVEDRVLATNPILESFGNSKTSRNNNSSRFGKWLEISFVKTGSDNNLRLVGANITQYLLEKSRVVVQSTEERNYHIFYQLCADPSIIGLQSASTYRFLNQSGCVKIDDVDDLEEFRATEESIKQLGFSEESRDTIFSALKAILLLGNVDFTPIDKNAVDAVTAETFLVSIAAGSSEDLIGEIATLLGFPAPTLKLCLTVRNLTIRGETTQIPFDVSAATDARNALAKEIYGRLFNFIVAQANESLKPTVGATSISSVNSSDLSIGLLDIFGFEKFKVNSFEQLCINYANEKLQQYFISFILKKELELYAAEGIEGLSSGAIPIDNTDVLLLIEDKKRGIFAKLDDELKLPKSSDETFLKKIETEHNGKQNVDRRFVKDIKMGKTQFEVKHFAGVIRYDARGFMEKNRDKLFEHLEDLLASSARPAFRDIMVNYGPNGLILSDGSSNSGAGESGKSNTGAVTIATRFTSQLQKLMNVLEAATPHFIKCIKPNNTKACNVFDSDMILLQLRYSGMLEAIQIRKSGFPTRRSHVDFRRAYWMLPRVSKMGPIYQENDPEFVKCTLIVQKLAEMNPDLYAETVKVGRTLVFLKSNVTQLMEREKMARGRLAVVFTQSAHRRKQGVKRYAQLHQGRLDLLKSMAVARLNNSGNIDAIPALTAVIYHCKDALKLICHVLREAEILLLRLHEVKDCLALIKTCLSHTSRSGSSYADVISEFTELTRIMHTAEALNIAASQLVDIQARISVLNDRAVAVLQLRAAVEQGDEVELENALTAIDRLKSVHGVFCAKDEAFGREFQQKIANENSIVTGCIEQLEAFQSSYKQFLGAAAGGPKKKGGTAAQSWLSDHLATCNSAIVSLLAPYGKNMSPISPMSTAVFSLMRVLVDLHISWSAAQWSAVATGILKVLEDFRPVDKRIQGLKRPLPALQRLKGVVDTYLELTETAINQHYLQPLISSAVSRGRVRVLAGTEDTPDYASIDYEQLVATMDEVKNYSWCNAKNLAPLFARVDLLVELRSAFVDDRVEAVLELTESREQTAARRSRRREYEKKLQQYMSVGSVSDDQGEDFASTTYSNHTPVDLAAHPAIASDFAQLLAAIHDECLLTRVFTLDKHLLSLITGALGMRSVAALAADMEEMEEHETPSSGPLELMLQEVFALLADSNAATDSATSVVSSTALKVPFAVNELLLECVNNLRKFRDLYVRAEYEPVFQQWDDKVMFVEAIATDKKTKPSDETARQNLLSSAAYATIRAECMRIVTNSFSCLGAAILSEAVKIGAMRGAMGAKDKKSMDVASLEQSIVFCEAKSKLLHEFSETSEEFNMILAVSQALLLVRKSFLEKRDPGKQKALLEKLNYFSEVYAFPPELEAEVSSLQREIDYGVCLECVIQALDTSDRDMRYLIPAVKTRKKTMLASASRKASSLSFDMPTGTSANNSFGSYAGSDETDALLLEDELKCNEDALEVEELENALNTAKDFVDTLAEGEDLPVEFKHLLEALEAIKQIRDYVYRGKWVHAQKVLHDVIARKLVSLAPVIEPEISECTECINNYAVISTCREALGNFVGSRIIGYRDYKSNDLQYLDEATQLCQATPDKSSRAESLFQAVLMVAELRRAQKNLDWGAIKVALDRIQTENIGRGASSVCWDEVSASVTERDNYDAVQGLKRGIVSEEMTSKDSLLDVSSVAIKNLLDGQTDALKVPEIERGPILKGLMSLTDDILKTRKNVIKRDWYVVAMNTPNVASHLEAFQRDIEALDKVGKTNRKGVSFLSASERGSILVKDRSKSESDILVAKAAASAALIEAEAPSSPTSPKTSTWDEFEEVHTSIMREIGTIELHFAVVKLEERITNALKEGGVKAESIGMVDTVSIVTDELALALKDKAALETSNHSLPSSLLLGAKVAGYILDMRKAVLADKWDEVGKLLAESLDGQFGVLSEPTRLEIGVVRLEVENRQIISNLTNALQTGKLEGELGKVVLKKVSCEHLQSSIFFCKSLLPRTNMAILLLHTAESMYALRKMICSEGINWVAVAKTSKELIHEVQNMKVHSSVMTELRLMNATAEDTILCDAMTAALEKGGPSGVPGALQLNTVTVANLEAACQLHVKAKAQKTEKANQLFTACRTVKAIREALLRTSQEESETASEAWTSIRALSDHIFEIRSKSPSDSSWTICREELNLVNKEAHIQLVRSLLYESIYKCSHIYAKRNAANISDIAVKSTELLDSCAELSNVLSTAKRQEFDNDKLAQLVSCTNSLKALRTTIADEGWTRLRTLVKDTTIHSTIKGIPEARKEFAWIVCECHNRSAFEILETALQPMQSSVGNNFQQASSTGAVSLKDSPNFEEHSKKLEDALTEVQQFRLSSKATLQLKECCEYVLLLRKSLKQQDNAQVAHCLRWFKANVHLCPGHVQQEAQHSYVMHQNDLLFKGLTRCLQMGKASGQRGDLDLSTIDTESLAKLITQAKDVVPKADEVVELLEAAETAQSIRSALKIRNMNALSDIVDVLALKDSFNLLIVDEIATARAELDNQVVVTALTDSLRSFDDAESLSLDLSFFNSNAAAAAPPSLPSSTARQRTDSMLSEQEEEEVPVVDTRPKMPGQSILNSFSVRRYSFANKNNANIDPDTIDVDVLDRALRIAEDHGVYSSKARMLFNTVTLIRSLRATMKQSEWPKLAEILSEAKYEEKVDIEYDSIASKEILAIGSQLEMRAAVVDLSKALKVGWAKCSNGIVNTSELVNDVLAHAIDRADKSILELSGGHDQHEEDMTAVQKQVQLMMSSAKLVLKIRDTLQSGFAERAGMMAEEGLRGPLHYSVVQEMTLYATEINAALATMKVFEALRNGMKRGNIEELSVLLADARAFYSHYHNDLGLIRTLERAEAAFKALNAARDALKVSTSSEFDMTAVQNTIARAEKLHLEAPEVDQARQRLTRIFELETFVEKMKEENHGILATTAAFTAVLDRAAELRLSAHPVAQHARTVLSMTTTSFRASTVSAAFKHSNVFNLASETIRAKMLYLDLPSSQSKYKLENFIHLRSPDDFGMRMNTLNEGLKTSMLFHSDQPLPTSLTRQSAVLSALSVWVFVHGVRAIERQMYSMPELMLRKIVVLGRAYVPLRDEVLMQTVKQIRNNNDVEACTRLWRVLSCCLFHFPPSADLESHLDLFLLSFIQSMDYHSFAKQSMRFMHQSILKYGYGRKIRSKTDISTEAIQPWLSTARNYYAPPPSVDDKQQTAGTMSSKETASGSGSSKSTAKPSMIVDVFVDPALDSVFPALIIPPPPPPPVTPIKSIGRPKPKPVEEVVAPAPKEPAEIIRGSREDWVRRFKQFNHDFTHKEGGHMHKRDFAATLASSIAPLSSSSSALSGAALGFAASAAASASSGVDRFDVEILYFLLFGKHIHNRKGIYREFLSDATIFHFDSVDESLSSEGRRAWLEQHVATNEKSSELFFSQLKASDLTLYAERFWDKVFLKMSTECPNWPFFKWEGDEARVRSKSIHPGQLDVTISWELYRELILTGMKKYLDQDKVYEINLQS